ncbi:hypothetical protein [Bifidobacterium sp.]|uniref:hypothetical protein n=1 Tax=Bifidobacterium sp. TaxID=41200 RepID=UPI0025B98F13|nr:hypothetical protein [Bifidobacterium sp.]MCH4209830.1 hypothetical protein [Bifidobacterium sp.]
MISTLVIVLATLGAYTVHTLTAAAATGTTRAYAVLIHDMTAEQEMTAAYSWEPKTTGGWQIYDRSMVWTSTPAKTGNELSLSVSAVLAGGAISLHAVKVSGLSHSVISTGNVSGTYNGGVITITLNNSSTLTITPSANTVHLTVKEA